MKKIQTFLLSLLLITGCSYGTVDNSYDEPSSNIKSDSENTSFSLTLNDERAIINNKNISINVNNSINQYSFVDLFNFDFNSYYWTLYSNINCDEANAILDKIVKLNEGNNVYYSKFFSRTDKSFSEIYTVTINRDYDIRTNSYNGEYEPSSYTARPLKASIIRNEKKDENLEFEYNISFNEEEGSGIGLKTGYYVFTEWNLEISLSINIQLDYSDYYNSYRTNKYSITTSKGTISNVENTKEINLIGTFTKEELFVDEFIPNKWKIESYSFNLKGTIKYYIIYK